MAGSGRVSFGSSRVFPGSKNVSNPNAGKDWLARGGFVCSKKVFDRVVAKKAVFGSFDGIKASLRCSLCSSGTGKIGGNQDKGLVLLGKF
jgi:hypothetical protein